MFKSLDNITRRVNNLLSDETRKNRKKENKFNRKNIFCNENSKEYESLSQAAKQLNINVSDLSQYLKGRVKSVKGFTFRRL